MSQPPLVLGVDGGTTKTVALVARTDGEVVGHARGVGSNIYVGSPEENVATITETARAATAMAGIDLGELAATCLSLAGADCAADVDYITAQADAAGLGRRLSVVNDSIGALYAACPTGPAAVAVCGTGFTASARASSGRRWYGGHWTDWASSRKRGYLGGQAMAEAAVRAVVDEELGLGPATELTGRLLASFGADTVEEMLHAVTERGVHHSRLRSDVTGQLLVAANAGDPVALSRVTVFGAAMGDLVGAAATLAGAGAETLDLGLMGSVLRAPCPALQDGLLDAFARKVPAFTLVATSLQPAHGAVLCALERLGEPSLSDAAERLATSSPTPELFHTAAGVPVAVGELS